MEKTTKQTLGIARSEINLVAANISTFAADRAPEYNRLCASFFHEVGKENGVDAAIAENLPDSTVLGEESQNILEQIMELA